MKSVLGSARRCIWSSSHMRKDKTRFASFSSSFLFDDTQLQFEESVNQFALENIAPHASKIDHNYFPKEVNLWKLMGDLSSSELLHQVRTLVFCCPLELVSLLHILDSLY